MLSTVYLNPAESESHIPRPSASRMPAVAIPELHATYILEASFVLTPTMSVAAEAIFPRSLRRLGIERFITIIINGWKENFP